MFFILGSSSAERNSIFTALSSKGGADFEFTVITSGFPERLPKADYKSPEEYIRANVLGKCQHLLASSPKANDILKQSPGARVVTADTILVDESGSILEKPSSESKMEAFTSGSLRVLSCAYLYPDDVFFLDEASLELHPMPDYEAYVREVPTFYKCAGGVDVSSGGTWRHLISRLHGELDVVRGFPTEMFVNFLCSNELLMASP